MVSDTMQPQFEDAGAVSPMSWNGTVGSQRRTKLTICCAHIPTVLWRLPSFSLTSGVVGRTHKNGNDSLNGATRLDKGLSDEGEQVLTYLQRRPARSIEPLVKRAKVALQMMAGLPQSCCHGSPSSGQECSS